MRTIPSSVIIEKVEEMIASANFSLPEKVRGKIAELERDEKSPAAKTALGQIQENSILAEKEQLPLCQDTGSAVFFIEMGNDVHLEEPIGEILDRAVKEAYSKNSLRKSIVEDPLFSRKNTGTNTPSFLHIHMVRGDELKISFLPKGGGAENKSRLTMLRPADGKEGVRHFVLDTVKRAGGAACPPWIIGIGIGGTFDTVAALSKSAILREIGAVHPDPYYAAMEKELFEAVDGTGIGTMGYGGKKTVMAVHILAAPCHIASLPVAVNIQCHSARSKTIVL